jgi:hypothetical protein
MIKKTVEKERTSIEFNGADVLVHLMEDQYIDEPISTNICDAINDFYNLMHLIEHSWTSKKYTLKMRDAGYDIYDKDGELQAWIGVTEKSEWLRFIIYAYSKMSVKAEDGFKGTITIYDYDEDLWIYSELKISDISKEKTEEKQREIVKHWINENVGKLL